MRRLPFCCWTTEWHNQGKKQQSDFAQLLGKPSNQGFGGQFIDHKYQLRRSVDTVHSRLSCQIMTGILTTPLQLLMASVQFYTLSMWPKYHFYEVGDVCWVAWILVHYNVINLNFRRATLYSFSVWPLWAQLADLPRHLVTSARLLSLFHCNSRHHQQFSWMSVSLVHFVETYPLHDPSWLLLWCQVWNSEKKKKNASELKLNCLLKASKW